MKYPMVVREDVSRVIQGVLAGTGFLCAGAIVMQSHSDQVRGLTTAASLPTTAPFDPKESKLESASADLGFIGSVSVSAAFETLEAHGISIPAVNATLKNFILPPVWKR
jgi:hypothetical protein